MPEWFWPRARAESTVLVRLGRVIHWIGYAVAAILVVVVAVFGLPELFSASRSDKIVSQLSGVLIIAASTAAAARAARYVLSGE